MTGLDRLRQLASALPSDHSAVTLTRVDLFALLDDHGEARSESERHMTVKEVAEETGRAPSTVRGWLISRTLHGYKINDRHWRIPRSALRKYLAKQTERGGTQTKARKVDIADWRRVRGA